MGRKVRRSAMLWIIATLTLAASAISGNPGPIRSAPMQADGQVDPIASAAATALYQTDPPAGQPVVVSRPLDRSDAPIDRRVWTVMWLSSTGRLCGAVVAPPSRYNHDSFCYTDQAAGLTLAAGRATSSVFIGGEGFLQASGLVRPDIATVTASTAVTPEQTATVVRLPVPNGTDFSLFALTLYFRDASRGDITWIFRDAHGSVVATEVTDAWGRRPAAQQG